MSQFYGVGAWPGSWSANGEVTGPYAAGGAQIGGWSTSWDEMVSDSARMLRKQDASSQPGAQVNPTPVLPGFGGPTSVPGHLAAGYDKPSASYFELLPGQTWDQAVPAVMPTKPQFSHSQPAPTPNDPKPIAKPSPAPASYEWVEVTSSEGWTTSVGQMAPMTPTKPRQKLETPSSPSSASQAPPSPNNAGNIKRHRDIEDELGHQDRYKTELCRSWHESGSCRYGTKCQFAHGAHELRPVMRHPKYKTEPCRSWVETRTCPYGRRCRFIHSDTPSSLSSQHPPAPSSHPMSSHGTMVSSSSMQHLRPQMHGVSQSSSAVALSIGPQHNGTGGVDSVSPSHPLTPSHLSSSATSPPSSMMMMSPHHMYMGGHEMSAAGQNVASSQQQAAALRLSSPYAQQRHMSHLSHQHPPQQHSLNQHHYQQQPFGGWSTSPAAATANGQTSLSPPYNTPGNLGFGMPLFNGSPPMTTNSAEHLAAARASNAPWLNDIYQEDDLDEYDPLSESLRLTPLIEQLNLHAEPVSPSATNTNGTTTAPATPIARPAPIGSRVSPDAAHSVSSTSSTSSTPNASTSSQNTDSTSDSAEKGKKKKTSRLNIFQRLSSK